MQVATRRRNRIRPDFSILADSLSKFAWAVSHGQSETPQVSRPLLALGLVIARATAFAYTPFWFGGPSRGGHENFDCSFRPAAVARWLCFSRQCRSKSDFGIEVSRRADH